MPELRRDPIAGYWTIIAEERGWRPMDFRPRQIIEQRECPFCEGRESHTPGEIYALRPEGGGPNSKGWRVRTFTSKVPILSGEAAGDFEADGIYDYREGVGHHEVIVETPDHGQDLDDFELSQIEAVLKTYLIRVRDLSANPRYEYPLLFKNHGLVSGAATDVIRHSRSQLIAMPILPKRAKEQLYMAKNYYDRRERCVFCDILRQEKKEASRLVAENASFFAFCPFASRSPFEMWILPKAHAADFGRMEESAIPDLAQLLKRCMVRLRNLLDDPPYNLILHTAPFRHHRAASFWRTIEMDYHWSIQILPRLTHNAGFEWGTGIHINPTPPEEAAHLLREAPEGS